MYIDSLRQYCLSKPGVEETLPFGPDTLVFKVMGKAFALSGLDAMDCRVNLKCDPERAILLREEFPESILPGFHMNKKHWNTVICDNGLKDRMIEELVDHSYALVVNGLSQKDKNSLNAME